MKDKIEDSYSRKAGAYKDDNHKLIAQDKKIKLSARERIDLLLDKGTFEEMGAFIRHQQKDLLSKRLQIHTDEVITGIGKIHGRAVCVFSQDFTIQGGSLAQNHVKQICKIMDLAMDKGVPLIGIYNSCGGRIEEGGISHSGYADIFLRNALASGVVPQISVIVGSCAGGAVYSPALTDFIFMVENISYMFLTGPNAIKTLTNEEISSEDLGGAYTHASKSGVSHFTSSNEFECFENIRRLMSYIPLNNKEEAPEYEYSSNVENDQAPLNDFIPENPNKPYDMKNIINILLDKDSFFEVHTEYAENIICGFGRIGGRSIGIIANQPLVLAGVLDIASSVKAGRFVRFCDAFNISLLVLEDVPGFLPGTDQEWMGIIRQGAKLIYAFCEATVPKITVITRKAYGGAYAVMSSKHIRGDINLAWPTAEIAVMGAKGATEIIFKRDLDKSDDKEKALKDKTDQFSEKFANPYLAAERGFIDDIIEPKNTRAKLIKYFEILQNKVDTNPLKKHGNIPL